MAECPSWRYNQAGEQQLCDGEGCQRWVSPPRPRLPFLPSAVLYALEPAQGLATVQRNLFTHRMALGKTFSPNLCLPWWCSGWLAGRQSARLPSKRLWRTSIGQFPFGSSSVYPFAYGHVEGSSAGIPLAMGCPSLCQIRTKEDPHPPPPVSPLDQTKEGPPSPVSCVPQWPKQMRLPGGHSSRARRQPLPPVQG